MSKIKTTDKKIRQIYRKRSEAIAREAMYKKKNHQIKILIGIIVFESTGIIAYILWRLFNV